MTNYNGKPHFILALMPMEKNVDMNELGYLITLSKSTSGRITTS